MYSLSIDYIFNRVYDVLLWIKYTWLFTILRTNPDTYMSDHKDRVFDGLRDRGWFDEYLKQKDLVVDKSATVPHGLLEQTLQMLGVKLKDSDGDGIFNISDNSPYDPNNLTSIQLKERYQSDYGFFDNLRNAFGIGPKDSDSDGVPNSYEKEYGLDKDDPDTDHDEVFDGQELSLGTDPLNPDTDHDGVLDGRDEASMDYTISAIGPDSDSDGISDKKENKLGTDINNKDSDGDIIPDGLDTLPLDSSNAGDISASSFSDLAKQADGLHLSIQNPILSFASDFLSLISIFALIFFVYIFMRWLINFLSALNHFDHHFDQGNHNKEKEHKVENKVGHVVHDKSTNIGIPGLAVVEDDNLIVKPTEEDFEDHPRWSIIEGYMSSNHETLWRIGIMEADNMLREVLMEKGYVGVDVGEMLTNAKFSTVQLAWEAHKVRNRIAHEGSNFHLSEREAKRVNVLYEAVFRELNAIK